MCEWQVQHITRLVDESKTEHSALSRQRLDLLDCLDLDKAVEARSYWNRQGTAAIAATICHNIPYAHFDREQ